MEKIKEVWTIEIYTKENSNDELFNFVRVIDGKPNESYKPASKSEAIIWASHIIMGFEPPRKLIPLNEPSR